jgi:alcohol dehydrogenase (cytochrome c)
VVLFDLEIDGVLRKAAAQAGKTGWVYILDRITGEPLLGIEERPVPQEPRQKTSPTQPYPLGDAFVPQSIPEELAGRKLVNEGRIFTPFWDEEVLIRPGNRGGANWPPSSYDPSSHYLYVCAADRIRHFIAHTDLTVPPLGERFRGGMFGSGELQPENIGIVAAMDMRTNRLVWRQEWKTDCYAGSVVTAGGLVFLGKKDGNFLALDSRNGDLLWQFQTRVEVSGTATVFQEDGQQYIVVLAAGARADGSSQGDSLWLFSLTGTLEPR